MWGKGMGTADTVAGSFLIAQRLLGVGQVIPGGGKVWRLAGCPLEGVQRRLLLALTPQAVAVAEP